MLLVIGQVSALGGLLSGILITDGHFAGTLWDFATPLTLLIAIGIFCGYAVLGYTYLIKEERYANTRESFTRILTYAGLTGVALLLATLLLPRTNYLFFTRWSTPPSMYALYVIAAAIVLVACMFGYDAIRMRYPARLYYECLALFALGTLGMLVGTFPYLVPASVTIFDAASPAGTLTFMLWGIGPLLPIILAYQWYLHRIFSKKMPHETLDTYGS